MFRSHLNLVPAEIAWHPYSPFKAEPWLFHKHTRTHIPEQKKKKKKRKFVTGTKGSEGKLGGSVGVRLDMQLISPATCSLWLLFSASFFFQYFFCYYYFLLQFFFFVLLHFLCSRWTFPFYP